eukprot:scaffold182334_cov33-Tisochrysis_lutea.AAC.2
MGAVVHSTKGASWCQTARPGAPRAQLASSALMALIRLSVHPVYTQPSVSSGAMRISALRGLRVALPRLRQFGSQPHAFLSIHGH